MPLCCSKTCVSIFGLSISNNCCLYGLFVMNDVIGYVGMSSNEENSNPSRRSQIQEKSHMDLKI